MSLPSIRYDWTAGDTKATNELVFILCQFWS